ncbi:hypothetical protein R2601_03988 [Salipiger bermudensis HTCC2601]|uniref:Uncharacterized protein n=1 Tax=Salipiger bermudensis (strain DSM 26914 / JCM 13377 / KCTC 12554 / HTCC2601) TaxID=314265 RepID=Q0FW48_SALBH|nr:hypothetical protein R2601_03988 [Salipiger bermudensis HTCC2601]
MRASACSISAGGSPAPIARICSPVSAPT